jgi:hypothetical protein
VTRHNADETGGLAKTKIDVVLPGRIRQTNSKAWKSRKAQNHDVVEKVLPPQETLSIPNVVIEVPGAREALQAFFWEKNRPSAGAARKKVQEGAQVFCVTTGLNEMHRRKLAQAGVRRAPEVVADITHGSVYTTSRT